MNTASRSVSRRSHSRPTSEHRPAFVRATPSVQLTMQPKLAIGSVNDSLEREADCIADQVTRTPDLGSCDSSRRQSIDRKCDSCNKEDPQTQNETVPDKSLETVDDVLRSPGQPLDGSARAYFEPRFGQDFSGVRVHADANASTSAKLISASAYTVGSHIVFDASQWSPSSGLGRRLLAHELAHTIQQGIGAERVAAVGEGEGAYKGRLPGANSLAPGNVVIQRDQAPGGLTQSLHEEASSFAAAIKEPGDPLGRGAQKFAAPDRADWQSFFQQALQGVSGKPGVPAKRKAALAAGIADECMLRFHYHGKALACAKDSVPDPASRTQLSLGLSLTGPWGDSFKSALQGTAGGDFKSPSAPVKEAADIADQAVLASGVLDESLWNVYMKCLAGQKASPVTAGPTSSTSVSPPAPAK